MIHPLHALASAVRRAVHALRCPTLTGHDPMPMLGRGEYYLSIGRRGWRYGYQFKVSRGDMELLSEALTSLLAETRENGQGGWQWHDRPEHEDGLADWERDLIERQHQEQHPEEAP